MISGNQSFTAAGNMHVASLATICKRVVKLWGDISVEIVEKSCKKCSISNAM